MAPAVLACVGRVGVGLSLFSLSFASHVVQPIQLQRGVMLESLIWISLMGFFVGQIARWLKAPAFIGRGLTQQGAVTLRLGFLLAAREVVVIVFMAMGLLMICSLNLECLPC